MNKITDAEAAEVGVKKEVYQDWADVMQALWSASIIFFHGMGDDKRFFPEQKENEIFVGDEWKINANMVNNSYVEAHLHQGEKQIVSIRYFGDVNPICQSIFLILKSINNGK